jgi:cGMP-dependent protein kinase
VVYRDLEPDDKYVIIASDGVFEFITNQMVADEFAFHADPLIACKAVVAQAYHLWLQYEVRTDDITMIAMYLDDVPAPETFAPSSSFYAKNGGDAEVPPGGVAVMRQASLELGEQRPVRRVMSREKRKHMIEVQLDPIGDEADDDITEEEMKALLVPKSESDAELIGSAIKSNFLFQHLNATQRAAVIDVMKEVFVKAGDRVIRQGDRGDRFYVIDNGRFEVRVRPNLPPPSAEENGREKSNSIIMVDRAPTACKITFEPNVESLGSVVHVYESNANSHPGFGELSLM